MCNHLGKSFLTALKSLTFKLFRLISSPLHASLLSVIYHPSLNPPLFLGKSSDGTFPFWSKVLFGPFLYFIRAVSASRRFKCGGAPYTEICEGLYVGGWPDTPDKLPPGNPAVVDCTCELPRKEWLSGTGNAYLCIPTWDARAPRVEQIEAAVKWACEKKAQNTPVFIHCAHGHGRSVTVMCALLVALGLAEDWKSAENMIKAKRPCIHLNVLHRSTLEQWSSKHHKKIHGEAF